MAVAEREEARTVDPCTFDLFPLLLLSCYPQETLIPRPPSPSRAATFHLSHMLVPACAQSHVSLYLSYHGVSLPFVLSFFLWMPVSSVAPLLRSFAFFLHSANLSRSPMVQ